METRGREVRLLAFCPAACTAKWAEYSTEQYSAPSRVELERPSASCCARRSRVSDMDLPPSDLASEMKAFSDGRALGAYPSSSTDMAVSMRQLAAYTGQEAPGSNGSATGCPP